MLAGRSRHDEDLGGVRARVGDAVRCLGVEVQGIPAGEAQLLAVDVDFDIAAGYVDQFLAEVLSGRWVLQANRYASDPFLRRVVFGRHKSIFSSCPRAEDNRGLGDCGLAEHPVGEVAGASFGDEQQTDRRKHSDADQKPGDSAVATAGAIRQWPPRRPASVGVHPLFLEAIVD
jgi:hypothetical protein